MNQTLSTLAYDCWSVCICSTNDYFWLTMEIRFHSTIFNKGWKIPEHLLVFVLDHPCFLADLSATGSPSPTYPPLWLLWKHLTGCTRAFARACLLGMRTPQPQGWCQLLESLFQLSKPTQPYPSARWVIVVVLDLLQRLAVTSYATTVGYFSSGPLLVIALTLSQNLYPCYSRCSIFTCWNAHSDAVLLYREYCFFPIFNMSFIWSMPFLSKSYHWFTDFMCWGKNKGGIP